MAYTSLSVWVLITTLTFTGTLAEVEEFNGKLYLKCPKNATSWLLDNEIIDDMDGTDKLDLGSIWDDPRGYYSCKYDDKVLSLTVYVRMCQNCIEVNTGTISGFLVADLIMIVLIAMAVYFVSGSETRRPARASDKQMLIQNEDPYQKLHNRQESAYSQLNNRK
ncbi:T-cell surface glyco CD3 delta chain [Pelobates cultripes]|uniref:T-cell surface glyco CD3 delta chain, partial n=1 Tax=Pelobates cultripes TaxID=61616 RepID=A0AAD1T9M9_PELCU|nr:T-cell surface glyco CD3 delta chain [Pelobates cultripes]